MKKIIFLLLLTLINVVCFAQDPKLSAIDKDQIRKELDARGFEYVSMEEMEERLKAKDIDINDFELADAPLLEEALKGIYDELEQERVKTTPKTKEEKIEEKIEKKEAAVEDKKEDDDFNAKLEEDVFNIPTAEKKNLVYGQAIFEQLSLGDYTKNTDIRASPDYILGEGDEIIINITGMESVHSKTYVINKGGITPEDMGTIFLKGMTFEEANDLLFTRFREFYRFSKDDFKMSLNFSRNILVNVTGAARQFGSFRLPAINTAFTALIAAKGPNKNGSVRNITIRSGGKAARSFDIYEYLLDPSIADDYTLVQNDYVHIPVLGKVVGIDGAVRRPHKYELKEGEGLNKLIFWAGGLSSNAYRKSIRIVRYEDDLEKIITVDLGELKRSGRDFELKDGDRVNIPPIPSVYRNFVSIEGSVDLPGRYEFIQGMRASDLILQGQLQELAKLDVAYLFRKGKGTEEDPIKIHLMEILDNPAGPANILLEPKDRVVVFSEAEFEEKNRVVKLAGAVRNPNQYKYSSDLRVSDVITFSGGLRKDATGLAFVVRETPTSIEPYEYLRVDLLKAMDNPKSDDDMLLNPRDSIVVYSYKDVNSAPAQVAISGSVINPQLIPFSTGMTLRDLIIFAGGFKRSADLQKIILYRLNFTDGGTAEVEEIELAVDEDFNISSGTGEYLLEPFDRIEVRRIPNFELQQYVTVEGEVEYPGPYTLLKPNERISDIIKRAGGFEESAFREGVTIFRREGNIGYLVLDYEDVMKNPDSPSNYILEKGDVVRVPKKLDIVSIVGYTNILDISTTDQKVLNVPFEEGKHAMYYVNKYAGGVNRDAGGRKRLIKVKQPGGSLEETKNYGIFKKYPEVQPGATIVIGKIPPEKEEEKDKERKSVDWAEVVANTVAQATAILTLVILIQRVQ